MNAWQTSMFKLLEREIKNLNHGDQNLICCKTITKIGFLASRTDLKFVVISNIV